MMEAPKVCRGCFREWEEGNPKCPDCGWEPGKTYGEVWGWRTGDIFEKRYLLGMMYCQTTDAAVWRIYDTVLGISHFALRVEPEDEYRLYLLAKRMKESKKPFGNLVSLMAIKTAGEKSGLFFSIAKQGQNPEALKSLLCENVQTEDVWDIGDFIKSESPKEQALPPGTILNGRYQILDCVGIGGFGIIYLCKDFRLWRLVAVKEYFPAEWADREGQYVAVKKSRLVAAYQFGLQSFYKEAKMMAKFLHTPHFAAIYDVMEANDTAYLVMEYISGTSIGREMRERNYRPYQPKEMGEILFPVFEALSVFHEGKIIHSDLSPGNIMRSKEGEIFLVDLGAAKYALHSQPALSAAFLKLDYAAPEQYQTAREGIPRNEGPWTDIYALGATIYYLLAGEKPPDVMQRLNGNKTDVVLPKRCRLKKKKHWTKLINRAMALDIRERIHSVDELREEMMQLLKQPGRR